MPAQPSPITLVTGYFELEGTTNQARTRSPRDYYAWMENFIPCIRWPLVIFCGESSLERIKRLRGQQPAVYVVTSLDEFCVYPYRDILRTQCRNGWPGLPVDYSILVNEKPNFLRRAIAMNPFGSEMFFWCDIGVFRPSRLSGAKELFCLSERIEWPDLRVCRTACSDKVALVSRRASPTERMNWLDPRVCRTACSDKVALVSRRAFLTEPHPRDVWIFGTFFGGSADPLCKFCDTFYACLRQRVQRGDPVRSEEAILRDTYAVQSSTVCVILPQDICWWLRWLNFRCNPPAFWWYFLNGNRFPRHYFRNEISLRQAFVSLFLGLPRKTKDVFKRWRMTR